MQSVVFSDNPLESITVPEGEAETMALMLQNAILGVRTNAILHEGTTPKLQWDGVDSWLPIGVLGETYEGTEGFQFSYHQHSSEATITGYVGTNKDVIIPSTVINNGNEYTITYIGSRAFAQMEPPM